MTPPNTTPPRVWIYNYEGAYEEQGFLIAHKSHCIIGDGEYISKVEVKATLLKIRAELEPAITNGNSEGEIDKALELIDELLKESV